MSAQPAFDLRAAVLASLDGNAGASPAAVAAKVLEQIPGSAYRDVLTLTLTDYVRHANRSRTPTSTITALRSVPAGTHVSPKVVGMAAAWASVLARQVQTKDGYVVLAQASPADLRWYAATLDVQAARTKAAADGYRALATLMKRRGITRVADVDPGEATHLLGSAS